MRITLYLALGVAAAGVVPATAAYENLPPVGCIVTRTERQPRAELIELVKARYEPTTKTGKTTMTMIGQVVQGCRRSNGWSKPREDAAVQYFSMRVLHDDAIEQGRRFGLTEPISAGYIASLTPDGQASYAAGKVTPELNRAAFAHLEKSGLAIATLKAEEIQVLGQAFNMAIFTGLGQVNAERAYVGK